MKAASPKSDYKRWSDFAVDNHLLNQSLSKYYLGHDGGSSLQLKAPDLEKMINELFQDFVEIGALQLPDGCNPSQYEIVLKDDVFRNGTTQPCFFMISKALGREEIVLRSPGQWFDGNTPTTHWNVSHALGTMQQALFTIHMGS